MNYIKDKIGVGILSNSNNNISGLITHTNTYVCYTQPECKIENVDVLQSYRYLKPTCDTWGKNQLLRMMINDGCEHLFLLSDSAVINNNIFEQYITVAALSGMWHLTYNDVGEEKNAVDYGGISIRFQDRTSKTLNYYNRAIIKNVGFYDDRFENSILEQDELTYRVIKAGLLPGWKWFPSIERSNLYPGKIVTTQPETKTQNWWYEKTWFRYKHKIEPDKIPVPNEQEVIEKLKTIQTNYKR